MVQIHVSRHFQKIIKNISKMIFEKLFLQLLLYLFEETFCKNFSEIFFLLSVLFYMPKMIQIGPFIKVKLDPNNNTKLANSIEEINSYRTSTAYEISLSHLGFTLFFCLPAHPSPRIGQIVA